MSHLVKPGVEVLSCAEHPGKPLDYFIGQVHFWMDLAKDQNRLLLFD